GVVSTPAQETTKTVKIMHIATIYDKNGKATHEPALRAYNTVSVVSDPVTLKDEKGKDAGKFYKLAGKDQYIKVGNVDGTSRSLKHNSYVYKSTGKRRGKTVLKKNSSVTTYGKSFMIAGHQMYRIGENQYVKKANF
ncbi:SLAP domain-containing protein, partial [Lactobacillus kitasatonis]